MRAFVFNGAITTGVTLSGVGVGLEYGLGAGLASAGLLICALSVAVLYLVRGLG